jgi:hypothetical protein
MAGPGAKGGGWVEDGVDDDGVIMAQFSPKIKKKAIGRHRRPNKTLAWFAKGVMAGFFWGLSQGALQGSRRPVGRLRRPWRHRAPKR